MIKNKREIEARLKETKAIVDELALEYLENKVEELDTLYHEMVDFTEEQFDNHQRITLLTELDNVKLMTNSLMKLIDVLHTITKGA